MDPKARLSSAATVRIYSEYVPFEVLEEPELLDRLSRGPIQLAVAVQPHQTNAMLEFLRAIGNIDKRPSIAIWPMLEDADGRWLNTLTFERYALFAEELVEQLPANTDAWIFDVEPPLHDLRRVMRLEGAFSGQMVRSMVADWEPMHARLTELLKRIHATDLSAVAAAPAVCAFGIERALGTPISSLAFDEVDVMVYPSLLEGYLGLSRRASQRTLKWLTRSARRRWGDRARIALGITGPGALGDERPYDTIEQLQDDAIVTRRHGISGLSLHGLAGALNELDRWLYALAPK